MCIRFFKNGKRKKLVSGCDDADLYFFEIKTSVRLALIKLVCNAIEHFMKLSLSFMRSKTSKKRG